MKTVRLDPMLWKCHTPLETLDVVDFKYGEVIVTTYTDEFKPDPEDAVALCQTRMSCHEARNLATRLREQAARGNPSVPHPAGITDGLEGASREEAIRQLRDLRVTTLKLAHRIANAEQQMSKMRLALFGVPHAENCPKQVAARARDTCAELQAMCSCYCAAITEILEQKT